MRRSGLVTVLFTDLVDSTRLLVGLGPDAGDELRRAHFTSLRRAIEEHGGEEVKSTGDGLMVVFDRPSDGVACAVELQRQTARLAVRYRDHPVAIRVGIAVGEATHEDGDWFGTPVVEAARLCAAAEAGQILATDVVRALAAGRGSFVEREPVSMKGLPHPVAVVAVSWEREEHGSALPALLANMPGRQIFVGRSLEAERLVSEWKRSLDRSRRAVFIAGEPGVGKTRLARELAVTAAEAAAVILYGRCDEELGLPYQPFVEALQHYVASCPIEVLTRHVASWGGELGRIAPVLSQRIADLPDPVRADPEVERHRFFEAVVDVLVAADEGAGVVLILDDLHWADRGTLLLLRHLLRIGEPMALLVLGVYRDTDLSRKHPLSEMLADLRRHDDVERLALGGLGPSGVEAFVEAAAGEKLTADGVALARAVFAETEGNPFFVTEVLRHLAESGAVYERDGRWRFDGGIDQLGIPEGVREVIGRRLSRLSEGTNAALRTAAVIGREFDLGLVAEVAESGEDAVIEALEEAVAARLVVEVPGKPDSFSFAHALVREALYDELGTSRRVRLHRRVATALERSPHPPLAALAHHFAEAAATGEPDKAIQYTLLAGEDALASLAYEDAEAMFARGIEVLDAVGADSPRDRVGLLLGLARARDAAGALDGARAAAVEAADIARSLHDHELFARAALAAVVGVPPIADEQAESLLEEATAGLERTDSALRAMVLAALSTGPSMSSMACPERAELTAEALAIARRTGDKETLLFTLAKRHDAVAGPANVEERLRLADEMASLAGVDTVGFAPVYQLMDRYEFGDIDGARAASRSYAAMAESTRSPGANTWVGIWTTNFLLFEGRFAEAEPALMGWFADHRGIPDDFARQCFGAQFFDLRRARGRCAEMEPTVRDLVSRYSENLGWRAALMLLLTELERDDELRVLFEEVARDDFSALRPDDFNFILNIALLTEACTRLRDGARAERLYEALLPYAGRNIVVGAAVVSVGAASRYLGMLAATMERWGDAHAHFSDALAMNERMGARPWLARCSADCAEMLLRSGLAPRARAEELLSAADRLARDMDMPALRRRVASLVA